MPISYEVDERLRFIDERWSGDIHARDLEAYWIAYLLDPKVVATRTTLVDLRESVLHFNGQELADLINRIVAPRVGAAGWKSAIVVDKPHQFGVSRQYQAFADLYSRDAIFHDRDEALRWLLQNT